MHEIKSYINQYLSVLHLKRPRSLYIEDEIGVEGQVSGSKLVSLCVHEINSYINEYLPVPHLKEPFSLDTENEKNASHKEVLTEL